MNFDFSENKLIASALFILAGLLLRWIVVRCLSRLPNDEEGKKKQWINSSKNVIHLMIFIGLILIWLSELRFVALSIAAFIVALVVATREFIQCLLGSLYLASSRSFAIGDWIQINGQHGEVVRSDWLSTTLLEIDMEPHSYSYTGKTLVVPNNQFVIGTIQNLNFMRRYIAHSFTLTRDADVVDIFQVADSTLEKAVIYFEPFHEVAQRYRDLIEKRLGVNLIGLSPSARVETTNIGKNQVTFTIFCPTQDAIHIEQQMTRDFMSLWYMAQKSVKTKCTQNADKNDIHVDIESNDV